ncbi:MAG: hypothetical protein HQM09_10040 [Candidatus Riflebacteria bacterium]|nr:hypothetical protein [Candidatus Riflebacteria bacterium]
MIRSKIAIALLALVLSSGAVFAASDPVPNYGGIYNGGLNNGTNNNGGLNNGANMGANGWQIKPGDQVMMSLLSMVISDLDMCRQLMQSNYGENILSIGHINNAQSALRRTDLDPAYAPLIRELLDRLGKIKFYLVMNDLPNVNMRLNQLQQIIRGVIGANGGQVIGGFNGGYNLPQNGGTSFPQGGGVGYPQNGGTYIPQTHTNEIPVGNMTPVPSR